ncbi:MAG: pentapeptide repeat-containing protein [Pseudomonadota bacterium]
MTRSGLLFALLPLFALGACSDVRKDELVLQPPPDCEAPAATRDNWRYIVLGTPYPVVNWTGCDKSGADLKDAYLGEANLTDTNLSGADLENADAGAAFLRNTNLTNANLRNVNLTGVYGVNVDATGADLTGTIRRGGTYQKVLLSGATWSDGKTICAEGSFNRCD